jgi:hypothetical protein
MHPLTHAHWHGQRLGSVKYEVFTSNEKLAVRFEFLADVLCF